MARREILIDVSRLIWRQWAGRLPTGIDRVCLAYLEHFGSRSQAVIQKGRHRRILSPLLSDMLGALLLRGGLRFRLGLVLLLPLILLSKRGGSGNDGRIYLNVGHTGLDEPSLPDWIAATGLRTVYLVHDLIPVRYPRFCRDGEAERHRLRMRNALKSAAGIIANSQATLDDLADFAAEENMRMPPSVAAWLAPPPPVQPAASGDPGLSLPAGRPWFVTLGTIEGRKNHALLLRTWQRLAARLGDQAPVLLVIGQRGWKADDVFALLDGCPPLKPHVRELGQCSDEDLAFYLSGARALLMPSFAEGFGLPVVEALAYGTPVLASDLPVYREIAGDIPLYLDPLDGQGWEAAIRAYCGDAPDRERQLAAMGSFHAPSWEDHFAKVDDWLASL